MHMKLPRPVDEKIKSVFHYIIFSTDPSNLGATKLNKVLWHADVSFYRKTGKTITGETYYIRMKKGPVANNFYDVIASLKEDKLIHEHQVPTPVGIRRQYVSRSGEQPEGLTTEEAEAIDDAISSIMPLSAAQASARTHGPIWEELLDNQRMPVRAASVVSAEILPEEIEWALENADKFK